MMSKKLKQRFNNITAAVIIATAVTPLAGPLVNHTSTIANATDLNLESSELKMKMDNLLKQENALKVKIFAARDKLMKTNSTISNAEIKISDLNNQKTIKQDKLSDINSEIISLKNIIEKENKSLELIYRKMQESNSDSAFSGITDLLPGVAKKKSTVKDGANSTVKTLKKQLEKDTNKLSGLKSEKKEIESDISNLNDQVQVQEQNKKDLQDKLKNDSFVRNSFDPEKMVEVQNFQNEHDRLQKQFNSLTDKVISHTTDSSKNQLKKQKKDLKGLQGQVNHSTKNLNQITGKEMDNLKVDLSQLNNAIDQSNNVNSNSNSISDSNPVDTENIDLTPTSTDNSSTQKALVKLILKQVGKPYIWGGEDPNSGFDCSGLMQYVFKQAAGISLPRISQDQCALGKTVPVDKQHLRAGDLVFWGSPAHHVAMMINDHLFVQAPEPGQNIKITDISWYTPNYAKRILNN